MLVPLNLPPGMRHVGTPRDGMGRWREGNLVRWVEGVMQPVKPWVRITSTPFPGRVSAVKPLRDSAGRRWAIVGTTDGVWAIGPDATVNVTPADFEPGRPETMVGVGFGTGPYSAEDYGTPRGDATLGVSLQADFWSMDYWGEFVLGCSTPDGRVLLWRPGDYQTPADEVFAPVTQAPVANRGLVVTDERCLMLIGAGGDPRKVQWSARENYADWAPTALNLAGDLLLETSGTLQSAIKSSYGIVVLSEVDAFLIRYVGQPYGYGRENIGRNCGVISPHGGVATSDFVVWMGPSGFWMYRGQLQQLPCDVRDFVYRDLNESQASQIACGHNAEANEIWWFFPKGEATRNSHYVTWNYRENWWAAGALARTAWETRGAWDYSLAADADGHVYEHEHEFTDPALAARPVPYIVSAPFELGQGDQVMHVTQLVPDQECRSLDALNYSFCARFAPVCGDTKFGPYYPNATGFTDTRFVGREFQWEVRAEQDVDWRLGKLRAEVAPGGRR